MRPTLIEILKIRSSLFLYGDRNGVSLNHLEKTTNGIFLSIESLIAADKELPKQMLSYLTASKALFKNLGIVSACALLYELQQALNFLSEMYNS